MDECNYYANQLFSYFSIRCVQCYDIMAPVTLNFTGVAVKQTQNNHKTSVYGISWLGNVSLLVNIA